MNVEEFLKRGSCYKCPYVEDCSRFWNELYVNICDVLANVHKTTDVYRAVHATLPKLDEEEQRRKKFVKKIADEINKSVKDDAR